VKLFDQEKKFMTYLDNTKIKADTVE